MDIGQFYDAQPLRRSSEEITFGDGWTTGADPHATYRAVLVVETGELVAVREPHPGGLLARYLDELHLDQADVSELRVEVIGTGMDPERAETALAGWPDQMSRPDSLDWLRAALN